MLSQWAEQALRLHLYFVAAKLALSRPLFTKGGALPHVTTRGRVSSAATKLCDMVVSR